MLFKQTRTFVKQKRGSEGFLRPLRDGFRCNRKELQRFSKRTVVLSREGMLTLGVSAAEVQQALKLAIVFIFWGLSVPYHATKESFLFRLPSWTPSCLSNS